MRQRFKETSQQWPTALQLKLKNNRCGLPTNQQILAHLKVQIVCLYQFSIAYKIGHGWTLSKEFVFYKVVYFPKKTVGGKKTEKAVPLVF